MSALAAARARVRAHVLRPEPEAVAEAVATAALSPADRAAIGRDAAGLVRHLRDEATPGLMEVMLAEYGLSTDEGLALMCLAEALLRVPDAATVDALIADKVAPGAWMAHFGHSPSALVNASTLGLALTGRVLGGDQARALSGAVRRLGKPVIRAATGRAMREMGRQFVLGETIEAAADRAAALERKGFTHSYDMLGEAAMTARDAGAFHASYAHAVAALAARCEGDDPRVNPGISIKLSALHPRYETAQRDRAMAELVPRVAELARAAAAAGMGLNVDAEEADRLDLSLDVIAAVLEDPALAGWDGFGVVVQGYGKRAGAVVDWLGALAEGLDRRIMVRLVKGAYWDSEVKRAQVEGLAGFPVFTRKAATDVNYVAVARKLLGMERVYPQFASHNAHTLAAILHMAEGMGVAPDAWEFQRLHGMGAALHAHLAEARGTRCRIYAPVGRHRELLAYLVRRLLENGANSSFVNQVMDRAVAPETVVADPFEAALAPERGVRAPADLFPGRRNSRGWDLGEPEVLAGLDAARAPWRGATWATWAAGDGEGLPVVSPVDPDDVVGTVAEVGAAEVDAALERAAPWDVPAAERRRVLDAASDALEAAAPELFALLAREGGKTLPDAVAELREAVDFLRFYGAEAARLEGEGRLGRPLGVVSCISPWNFPLAIFCGQVAAALAAGNAVLAKPAEATPLVAARAVALMHAAGVPEAALQLLPGEGATVGRAMTGDPRVGGVCFTGSTATARAIHRAMAEDGDPGAPLIAETGGLNAMVVDSTALPEQAVRDVVAGAFRSAGQRCSATRILYVQADVAEAVIGMLRGAMDELRCGDPWDAATDVGPLIDARAKTDFAAHVDRARAEGRLVHGLPDWGPGHGFGPALVRVGGIADLDREVFGPVLYVATFEAAALDAVIDAVNASGYGLTFGLHTRIEARAARVAARVRAGNVYVNRDQIGAVVSSQPFGGEGLSGTGPKAGGPRYVPRLTDRPDASDPADGPRPGPTGERNVLTTHPRGPVACLGPTEADRAAQRAVAAEAGAAEGDAAGAAVVAWFGDADGARAARRALAARDGAIGTLATTPAMLRAACRLERHVCTDTTAAGGDAALLGGGEAGL